MSVKSDSKGRLTGADPSTRYVRNVAPDGTLTFVPEVPREFAETRDVSQEQFEQFFGVFPDGMRVANDIYIQRVTGDDSVLPHGLVFERFVANGMGVHTVVEQVLIRIKR